MQEMDSFCCRFDNGIDTINCQPLKLVYERPLRIVPAEDFFSLYLVVTCRGFLLFTFLIPLLGGMELEFPNSAF